MNIFVILLKRWSQLLTNLQTFCRVGGRYNIKTIKWIRDFIQYRRYYHLLIDVPINYDRIYLHLLPRSFPDVKYNFNSLLKSSF